MTSRRERYERANLRGGMGVRKRLSEDAQRTSYRLNGVQTGSAVARCWDRFGRWVFGYTLGVIVRRTATTVQVRWLGDEEISTYSQGDARYEVDRQRWRILGIPRGNPLDPDEPLAVALTRLANDARMPASSHDDTPPTEENEDMAREKSRAAAEREAAQTAIKNGLKDRETYTAKQVATRCGTDAKTMRKFFRSSHSTVEAVGQGGRYEFDARDLPKIKKEFTTWRKRSEARSTQPKLEPQMVRKTAQDAAEEDDDFTPEQIEAAINDQIEQEAALDMTAAEAEGEPTEEDLADLEELDLDDLDAEEIED